MYPIMVDLKQKKVLVIGGGAVATRKVGQLLRQKAEVVVVSPSLTDSLQSYVEKGEIQWVARTFQNHDVLDAFLVIAATNLEVVNAQVKASCRENQLVNVVDAPEDSNFYNMASVERGKLKIAVSTEGASPLLAKLIKRDLQTYVDEGYEAYVSFLFEAREMVKSGVQDEQLKKFLLQELVDDRFRKNEIERDLFLKQLYKYF